MATDLSTYEDRAAQAESRQDEKFFLRQRRAINDAYAALQGRALATSFAAFTFEEAADAFIEAVEGADTAAHPNKLKQVARIKGEIQRAVEELKKVPPEHFLDANLAQSANTPAADDPFWAEDDSVA